MEKSAMAEDYEWIRVVLRAERERQRLSMEELAKRLGVSADYISKHESGGAVMTVPMLLRWMAELGIKLALTR